MNPTQISNIFTTSFIHPIGEILSSGLPRILAIVSGVLALIILVEYVYIWIVEKRNEGYMRDVNDSENHF